MQGQAEIEMKNRALDVHIQRTRASKINIPPCNGGFFIFGHSPNTTGYAQVRFLIGLPAMQLLLTTHKWVPWVKQT